MLGGETVKELYGRGKRHSVRGITSDFSISKATVCKYVRSPEVPNLKARPKRGSKFDGYLQKPVSVIVVQYYCIISSEHMFHKAGKPHTRRASADTQKVGA